jgi:hypothetical protein
MNALSMRLLVYRENTVTPEEICFTPEEYFDLDPDEVPDVDSVPLYSNLEKYLDNTQDVTKLALEIKNLSDAKALCIEKVFQNQRKSTVTTRSDYQNEVLIYREIIYESMLPRELVAKECACDVCRFVIEGDTAKCVYHGIFHYSEDGEEIEHRIL